MNRFLHITHHQNWFHLLFMLILVMLSIQTGVADFSWSTLFQQSEQMQLLLSSRIPRTAAIIITGATLAIAGTVLQIVLKNKFIEPNMIGATQSAAIGILLATLFLPSTSILIKMSIASVSSMLGMGIFLLLLKKIPQHQLLLVPLIGIVFGNIIEAIATFIAIETDSAQMLSVWFSGDFSAILAGRYELLWLTVILASITYVLADQLTIAGLGKNMSINLGIAYQKILWVALMLVALITAVVVVTVGQIPFIGLVVPNIVSRFAGDRLRQNLPSVALLGANSLLVCDILSRTINPPYEIPVSLLFGFIGTVVFLYLLFKRPNHVAR